MSKKIKIQKVKCKHCQTTLTTEVRAFQTCECGKISYDTDALEYYTRILGNQEDYEFLYEK